jgi:uncharacterized protein
MKKPLEEIKKNWTFQPPKKEKWLEYFSDRLQVDPDKIDKTFKNELQESPLDETMEIPDVMKITYKYSYGEQSPFFRALRDYGKLLGARCEACDFVYCPPRKNCSKCYGDTDWVELPGTGTVETFTKVYKGTSASKGKAPFICAYIKLDGSDFVMMSNIEMEDASQASVGMKVKVQMKEERFGRMTDFIFVPLDI